MTKRNDAPPGTVVTSEVVAQMAVDEVLDNLKTLFPDGMFETIPVSNFQMMVESFTRFGMKVGTLVASNRADLSTWTTAKTGTRVVGNPDQCEINAPGVTYELRYSLIERGPEGDTKASFTYDEAIAKFGQGTVDKMWGSFGEEGTHQIDCGDTTFWFSTVRVPIQKTFDINIQKAHEIENAHKIGDTQTMTGQADKSREVPNLKGSPTMG